MLLKQVIEIFDITDRANASGNLVKDYFEKLGAKDVVVSEVKGAKGKTDFVKIRISGTNGKSKGGTAKTLGILGRLGGLGARPTMIGFVSDGDGAVSALSVAAKLVDMQNKGDFLEGDVVVSTHICPDAPTQPHDPVPFMGSPITMEQCNAEEVDSECDAILSCDTTKGNKVMNIRGVAITPTVKEGYILKVSNDLLDIMQITTGKLPNVLAITTQDITPYGNKLHHINSILQPATATDAPVVGVAITAESTVPGCATGASHFVDIEMSARFMLEVAKNFGRGTCSFYDEEEFTEITNRYGSMKHLQTQGNN